MAGYSGTPLPKKLGITEGKRLRGAIGADGFADTLGELPPGAEWKGQVRPGLDVVVAFFTERAALASRVAQTDRRRDAQRHGVGRLAEDGRAASRPTSPRTCCATSCCRPVGSTTRCARSTTRGAGSGSRCAANCADHACAVQPVRRHGRSERNFAAAGCGSISRSRRSSRRGSRRTWQPSHQYSNRACSPTRSDGDRLVTPHATLTVAPVHREPTSDVGVRDPPTRAARSARSIAGRGVDEHDRVVVGEVADVRPRAQLGRPEDLAAVDVADPAHHTLVEHHVTKARLGLRVGQQQVDDVAEVGRRLAQVGTEPATTGMPAPVGLAIRLDDRRVEAHRHPLGGLDRGPQLVVRAAPRLLGAVEVPRPGHPHVGVRGQPVVPRDLEVLAVALDGLDGAPGLRHRADETRGVEAQHRVDRRARCESRWPCGGSVSPSGTRIEPTRVTLARCGTVA